ncbi:BPSS1780 family membrane protein, partial [Nakamurella sp. GG22]
MEKLPAKTGWIWVKSGFALFRRQPAEISTLFLAYMFIMLAVGIIPVLGQ